MASPDHSIQSSPVVSSYSLLEQLFLPSKGTLLDLPPFIYLFHCLLYASPVSYKLPGRQEPLLICFPRHHLLSSTHARHCTKCFTFISYIPSINSISCLFNRLFTDKIIDTLSKRQTETSNIWTEWRSRKRWSHVLPLTVSLRFTCQVEVFTQDDLDHLHRVPQIHCPKGDNDSFPWSLLVQLC